MATLFFSYSHQDNTVPQNWVDRFYNDLNSFARVYSGQHNLVIWKDDHNYDVKSEVMEQRLKDTPIFTCRNELKICALPRSRRPHNIVTFLPDSDRSGRGRYGKWR